MEVQKELYTRFKNKFESDMLLPNLDFNPEFQEKQPELLVLEETGGEDINNGRQGVVNPVFMNLATNAEIPGMNQDDNFLRPRMWWVPKSYKERKKQEEMMEDDDDGDDLEDWAQNGAEPMYYGHYHTV